MQLKKEHLAPALRRLSERGEIFVPTVVDDKVSKFAPWDGHGEPALDLINTKLPPKDTLFPHQEGMYKYSTAGEQTLEEIVEAPDRILFGVRPCDARSIDCMDKVFLGDKYQDTFYARRREHLTVIAHACAQAGPTCFCDSMGLNPGEAPSADLLLIDAEGGGWLVRPQTPKGEEIEKLWQDLMVKESEGAAPAVCTLKTAMSPELSEQLTAHFEDPIWDENCHACLGCGTCTYLCPTCYCFDINHEDHGGEGTQFRCWDSCMFSDYTRMAGGHNPRPSKKERLRNRYLHKLSYFKERYGQILCVGCGRCVGNCPGHLDITSFIDKAAERFGDKA